MKKVSLNKLTSLVVFLATIACTELSWMEGVVAKPDCTRDIDCSFRIKCGKGVITVCNKGQCQCVHPPRSGNPTSMNSSPAS
ncbi:hypothetical protein TIFTF001_039632 [Ficus carica]|uniref:Uncharacterized protein n=1 Tax=Ficus carica TaxID=3494 RepID=A0AA88EB76_FICCA|nr:hypothetical protein TIFTF001_039632 [Ficus carica]